MPLVVLLGKGKSEKLYFFFPNLSGCQQIRDLGLDLLTGKHQTKKTVVRLHFINGLQLEFFFSFVPADLTESYKNIQRCLPNRFLGGKQESVNNGF